MKFATWIATFFLFACSTTEKKESKLSLLRLSENRHFIQKENGEPFFWLGDTGWLLFSKLDREQANRYLDDRAQKGFNVIQVMVLHQLHTVNIYGDSALTHGDISEPSTTDGHSFEQEDAYDYWDHIDYVVDLAKEKGLYMALVPVWGSNVKHGNVSEQQAATYASWLAKRYADKSNIIWLNGGDTKGNENTAIWNTIGNSIRKNASNHLITFHPFGRTQSSMWFHDAYWIDFNMFQSGHRRYDQDDSELGYGQDNWKYIHDDYTHNPVRPTLDGEPSYEGIPQGLHDTSQPYWDADDIRRSAYWSVFAGGFGFTYGHNAVMQMHKPGDKTPAYGAREYWTEALDAAGAKQMKYLKTLMLSKPYFDRVPDQSLITSPGDRYDFQISTRGKDYAFVYTYNGRDMNINMGKIEGTIVKASWLNPRTGETTAIDEFENTGSIFFNPPGKVIDGNDWVLILESKK